MRHGATWEVSVQESAVDDCLGQSVEPQVSPSPMLSKDDGYDVWIRGEPWIVLKTEEGALSSQRAMVEDWAGIDLESFPTR